MAEFDALARWPDDCPACGYPLLVGDFCPSGVEMLAVTPESNPHAPRPDICREVGHCIRHGVCGRCGATEGKE